MGCVTMMCAQVPTIHAQRMLNGIAMANTAGFSLMAVVLSIYQGLKYHTVKDYGMSYPAELIRIIQRSMVYIQHTTPCY